MTRRKWKLTQAGDLDDWGDQVLRSRTEDRRRLSLLDLLAEDPRTELTELSPGVYRGPLAP